VGGFGVEGFAGVEGCGAEGVGCGVVGDGDGEVWSVAAVFGEFAGA
jgi:hypothetical protein